MIYLFISIDVEAPHGNNPVDQMIRGSINGERFGIKKIMDICEKYNVKSSFFLDVYEAGFYGINTLKQVALEIKNRGHDAYSGAKYPPIPVESTHRFRLKVPPDSV